MLQFGQLRLTQSQTFGSWWRIGFYFPWFHSLIMPLPSSLNGNFAQLHSTICDSVCFISLPLRNLELLFSVFFPVTIIKMFNVPGLHVFYIPSFLCFDKCPQFDQQKAYNIWKRNGLFLFFLSRIIFIWINGLKGVCVWLSSWNFQANLGFILNFKIIVDMSEINEI